MDISNKTVLVVGTGKSGVAAAKLLLHHAKKVYIQDGNEALDVAAFRSKNPELTPVELILGDVSEDMLKSFDIAVLSPGVPLDIPLVEKMKTLGMTIWGEIELAYVLGKGHVVAITGTNGKTTTTTLVGQIMARHFASRGSRWKYRYSLYERGRGDDRRYGCCGRDQQFPVGDH